VSANNRSLPFSQGPRLSNVGYGLRQIAAVASLLFVPCPFRSRSCRVPLTPIDPSYRFTSLIDPSYGFLPPIHSAFEPRTTHLASNHPMSSYEPAPRSGINIENGQVRNRRQVPRWEIHLILVQSLSLHFDRLPRSLLD
jgi:hypothetical protein